MAITGFLARVRHSLTLFFLPAEENDFRARVFSGSFLIFFLFFAVILKLGFAIFLYSFSNSRFFADITRTALVDLANVERARHNLPPLASNPTLEQAAYLKALDMAKNGYFAHTSPAGVSPWHWFDQAGYNYKYAGENLAIGFIDSREVQNAWAASPSHEANIVNSKYKDIGIAVLKANFEGNPATIVVQLFGSTPAKTTASSALAAAPATPKTETAAGASAPAGTVAAPVASAAGKNVMGASTVAPDTGSAAFRAASFLALKYYGVAQAVIYISLVFVILLLLANFAMKADFSHADLLVKAIGFIALMALFALVDHDNIVALIPHALAIQ